MTISAGIPPTLALSWPAPAPTELSFISPSALTTFKACQLRLAFQRDVETRVWSRKNTTAALGTVAHRLTELTLSGAAPPPTQRRPWLIEQWEALLHAEWVGIQAEWPDRTVDAPKHWPGEAATRVRLIRRLQGLAVLADRFSVGAVPSTGGHSTRATSSADTPPPAFPWIERKLYDDVRGLFGQPDRVEEVDGILRVVDLKSGVRQGEMTATQLQQLLLYAHLVEVSAGRLPEQVVVQNVKGNEQALRVSTVALADVVKEAVRARDRFNSLVSSGFPASPSPGTCGFCPFRVVCADYWDARDDDWPGSAVRGTVIAVGIDGVELASLQDPSCRARLIGEGSEDVVVGEELVSVDLVRAGPGAFRTRWNSAIRRGSQAR